MAIRNKTKRGKHSGAEVSWRDDAKKLFVWPPQVSDVDRAWITERVFEFYVPWQESLRQSLTKYSRTELEAMLFEELVDKRMRADVDARLKPILKERNQQVLVNTVMRAIERWKKRSAHKAAGARHAREVAEKARVRRKWDDSKNGQRRESVAQFALRMAKDSTVIKNPRTVERWVREWRKEQQPSMPNK